MTRIRFIRGYRNRKPGDVAEYFDGVADLLIRRGIAAPAEDKAEAAVSRQPTETAAKRTRRPRVHGR